MRSLICALFLSLGASVAAGRPNVVWLMSEDNSAHYLKLYSETGAATPNIEALAKRGLVFEHAFSNAPVCSVARTTLITGCYAPRIGTQFHRRSVPAAMPAGLRMFPAYLRDAGYYTTNNSKEDYNAIKSKDVWDESSQNASWRNRSAKDQPFFHVQTFADSHESSLHFPASVMEGEKTTADPATVTLAPYHADTPVFRHTHARYLDRIAAIDARVGQTVAQLSEDGLLEDTFIFYFGDHGGVLPRAKGYPYESGLHVPLVVRVPENWQHLADAAIGSRVSGFVEFVDFGPTVLRLAGLADLPEVDGRAFLGKGVSMAEVNQRKETFGHADRMDERCELTRTLRKGRYRYHRHYEAFYPDALQNNYRYLMLAYQDWMNQYQAGKLNAVQRQFFESKPPEALYDIETDPHQVKNLAGDPQYAPVLADLRASLRNRVKSMPDLSFIPEHVLAAGAMTDPAGFGLRHQAEIGRLIEIADLALLPVGEALPGLTAALGSPRSWERYWALTVLIVLGEGARAHAELARPLLADPERLNRVRAAFYLARIGAADPRATFLEALETSDSAVETLIVLNMAVCLRDFGPRIDLGITRAHVRSKGGEVERRLFHLTGEGSPRGNKDKGKSKSKPNP